MAGLLDRATSDAGPVIQTPAPNRSPLILAGLVALAGSLYAWAVFAASFAHDGVIGPHHNAPGSDWIVFHGAVQAFLDGNLALTADPVRFTTYLNEQYGWWLSSPLPFHPWLYPPVFLLVLLPFCWLPFLASYLLFQIASFLALAAAAWGLAFRKVQLAPLHLCRQEFFSGCSRSSPNSGCWWRSPCLPGGTGEHCWRLWSRPPRSRSRRWLSSAGKPGPPGSGFSCSRIPWFIRSGSSGAACGASASSRACVLRDFRTGWRVPPNSSRQELRPG